MKIIDFSTEAPHAARSPVQKIAYALMAVGLGWLLLGHAIGDVQADDRHVALAKIDGVIDPISARYLTRAVVTATSDEAVLLVLVLDTPGGLLDSMREMVSAIFSAEIPVAVYVSPPGAQAASAGTFVAAAANFAAMAPATNIGAASPVGSGGEDLPETLGRKVSEDTQAFIRSIAERRGRNAEVLAGTVADARSYSASEALGHGIVDILANDLEDLLVQVDGRTAETAAGTVVLDTRGAGVREIKHTFLENFLGVVANPNIAYVLLSLGSLALLAEFLSPGVFGPGIVGVIALGLAFVGLGQLPVNWFAVGLILFSMALFFFEFQAPGASVFGIGGVVTFVLGALLLFGGIFTAPEIPGGSLQVSRWLIGVIGGTAVTFLLAFFYLARSGGSETGYIGGSEGSLVGETGLVISELGPTGIVRVGEEDWTATVDPGDSIQEGREVRVVGVFSGEVLKVARPRPDAGERPRSLIGRLIEKVRK